MLATILRLAKGVSLIIVVFAGIKLGGNMLMVGRDGFYHYAIEPLLYGLCAWVAFVGFVTALGVLLGWIGDEVEPAPDATP